MLRSKNGNVLVTTNDGTVYVPLAPKVLMEIITGVERGRRWSKTDKLRIVAETQLPGRALP